MAKAKSLKENSWMHHGKAGSLFREWLGRYQKAIVVDIYKCERRIERLTPGAISILDSPEQDDDSRTIAALHDTFHVLIRRRQELIDCDLIFKAIEIGYPIDIETPEGARLWSIFRDNLEPDVEVKLVRNDGRLLM